MSIGTVYVWQTLNIYHCRINDDFVFYSELWNCASQFFQKFVVNLKMSTGNLEKFLIFIESSINHEQSQNNCQNMTDDKTITQITENMDELSFDPTMKKKKSSKKKSLAFDDSVTGDVPSEQPAAAPAGGI